MGEAGEWVERLAAAAGGKGDGLYHLAGHVILPGLQKNAAGTLEAMLGKG